VRRLFATNAELWKIFNKSKRWRIEAPSESPEVILLQGRRRFGFDEGNTERGREETVPLSGLYREAQCSNGEHNPVKKCTLLSEWEHGPAHFSKFSSEGKMRLMLVLGSGSIWLSWVWMWTLINILGFGLLVLAGGRSLVEGRSQLLG
jgi:hypothetical protein